MKRLHLSLCVFAVKHHGSASILITVSRFSPFSCWTSSLVSIFFSACTPPPLLSRCSSIPQLLKSVCVCCSSSEHFSRCICRTRSIFLCRNGSLCFLLKDVFVWSTLHWTSVSLLLSDSVKQGKEETLELMRPCLFLLCSTSCLEVIQHQDVTDNLVHGEVLSRTAGWV